jgi:hypothetical protein
LFPAVFSQTFSRLCRRTEISSHSTRPEIRSGPRGLQATLEPSLGLALPNFRFWSHLRRQYGRLILVRPTCSTRECLKTGGGPVSLAHQTSINHLDLAVIDGIGAVSVSSVIAERAVASSCPDHGAQFRSVWRPSCNGASDKLQPVGRTATPRPGSLLDVILLSLFELVGKRRQSGLLLMNRLSSNVNFVVQVHLDGFEFGIGLKGIQYWIVKAETQIEEG